MKKLAVLFVLLYSLSATGQPLVSSLEKYTIKDGLSSNETSALLQDSRGFLWIATDWGLNRYDGRSFKQYTRTGKNGLIHYGINSLTEDKEGNIWIGTNKGASRFDPLTESFTSWAGVGVIFADKQKNIWILNHDSVYQFNNGVVQKKYKFNVAQKDPNANRYIIYLSEDRHGDRWFSASNGLHKLDKAGKVTHYSSHLLASDASTFTYEDKDGDIWSGTWGDGLLKVNEHNQSLSSTRFAGNYSNAVFGMHDIRLSDRDFLLLSTSGTSGGLLLCEKTKGPEMIRIVQRITGPQTDGQSLSIHFKSILKDRQNNYWISSSDGLYKIDMSRQSFHWNKLPDIQSNHVLFHSIAPSQAKDSCVYISSIEGWWKLNTHDLSISPHTLPVTNRELALFINRYALDKDGWWFTSQRGFGFYNIVTNQIIDYSDIMNNGTRIDRSWGLVRDKNGKLWISLFRDGLAIYDPVAKKTVHLFNGKNGANLRGVSITDLRIDSTGFIWMATHSKLYRIDPADFSYQSYALPPGETQDLLITSTNRILIYNEEAVYEWKQGRVDKIFKEDLAIREFGEDNDGNFWLRSHNNFYRLSSDAGKLVSFTSGSGLNGSDVISEMSFYKNLCLVLAKGKLLCFETDKVNKNPFTSPVIISSVTANQEKYFFPGDKKSAVRLDYKDRLEIEIAALNLSNEGDNRIFYQLEGWDDQWKELLSGSVVSYEQLPAGHYTFLAKATNGDTELTKVPVQLHFRILPPFWKRWWFIGLLAVTIAGVVYWFYRYRLTQAIKMERLRTRIATDLHDDIGATLSSISMYSEAVKNQVKEKMPQLESVLDKMGENSRNMVSSMNDIVWAVNPGNDQGEKLLERMEGYARDACAVKDIKLHFQSNPEWSQHSFALEYRKNIYLVFKEALNNALKYSEASNIWVTIDKKMAHLHLTIRDDGKGFDVENGHKGNGLKNMDLRAKEIGGVVTIQSMHQQGTTIFLDCKPG
jgi:ligand-binding sensor domain-containing protein/two-component sensor histidine kinase